MSVRIQTGRRRTPGCGAAARAAFTLVELLVVIGIIALLVAILMPALSRAREQAKIVQCASNLRNIGQSIFIYAGQHKGKLPQHNGRSAWLWDLPNQTRDAMLLSGNVRDSLYCPTNDRQNVERLWDFQPGDLGYTVTGYFFMIRRPTAGLPQMQTTGSAAYKRKKYLETITDKDLREAYRNGPAETELAADATLSTTTDRKTATFTNVIGGWTEPHWTNHFKGNKAVGGNILFLDGHVTWRAFKEMECWLTGPPQWF